jgi:hypothetical protein
MESENRRPLRDDAAMAVLILLLGVFLAATGTSLTQRWHHSMARHQSLVFEDLIGVGANAVGLTLVAWWVFSLLLAFIAAMFELQGSRRAASVTGRFAPAFMRRLALAALGLQLMTAPLANAAAVPVNADPGPRQGHAVSAAWTPSDDVRNWADSNRPVADEPSPEALAPRTAESEKPAVLKANAPDPRWQPRAPVAEAGHLARSPLRTVDGESAVSPRSVAVVSGDSLWSIAGRHLGPLASDVDIALEWPRWYQVNRAVIGDNPNELIPGQILTPPAAS